ncbi:MAG: hypothetical protein ABR502_07445 [Chitinophagaceae bacterium]
MIIHFFRITIISALLLTFMFLPFIPGRYDSVAVTLSFMSQIFGMAGLPLIPIGLLWLTFELIKQTKKDWNLIAWNKKLSRVPVVQECDGSLNSAQVPRVVVGRLTNELVAISQHNG